MTSILPTKRQSQAAARRAKHRSEIPPTHCTAPGCTRLCTDLWVKDGCCSSACREAVRQLKLKKENA